MSQKVLVIGGTGMLGLPVARRLKADGFDVALMTTDVGRARAALHDEFELVYGDVTRPETLPGPIDGHEIVYLNLNARYDPRLYREIEISGTENVARTAAEAGVRRIITISGASSKGREEGIIFLDAKVRAERALMECGIPYTIMRPSWFFETLPKFVQGGRAAVIGRQPIKRSWLAAADYARQVSVALQREEAANKCFYSLGPQKLTILEAVTLFCARHYPEIRPAAVPYWLARTLALAPGRGPLRKMIPFFKYFETRPEPEATAETDRILGPNLMTLEEWLDSYRPPPA
jgi:NADH dehydrogenase